MSQIPQRESGKNAPSIKTNNPAPALQRCGVTQADPDGGDELRLLRAERKAITAEMDKLSSFIDAEIAALTPSGHFRTIE